MRNTADLTGGKPIAAHLVAVSDLHAVNPLVAFSDSHGRKREVLFFCFWFKITKVSVFKINISHIYYKSGILQKRVT
jgi:hypothetical protein